IQGHIAYPHLALNPIHRAMPALAELAAIQWDEGDAYFQPTSFQISNIHAGTGANNVIPGELQVLFNFRFSPACSVEQLKAGVQNVLERHVLDCHIDWHLSGLPFITPRGRLVSAVSRAIEVETGRSPELSTTGGTSDGRFIARHCPEVVELGPVNASIHQIDEHIRVDDIEALSRIYRRTLEHLLLPT
ncbi:MAG: M20/M25/M40 family metallo-hydrolase, partial [Burkholderiales bacterium]|nr:M20/M25/M40 family metallo-hydrolase [Burkholderiales bacterium]